MAQRSAPPGSLPRVSMTFADWRAGYKVALGVIGVGILMVVWSPFVGGALYGLVTPFIELLGAPGDREFLPRGESGTGAELLVLLGAWNFVAGVSMFCVVIVLDLLELGGSPALTRRVRPPGKAALGAAAAGAALFGPAVLLDFLLSELFVDHEQDIAWVLGALALVWRSGLLLLVCSLVLIALRGNVLRSRLLRWTEAVGWGKAGRGWINTLALALIAGSLINAVVWFLPFDDAARLFFGVGVTILLAGIVPHVRAGGRP